MCLMVSRAIGVEIDHGLGGDLAGEHDQAGVAQRLGGDARGLVLRQQRIEHRVGDLVRDFVRVAFGNRLRREQETADII